MEYSKPANQEAIDTVVASLEHKGYKATTVESKTAALDKIKELIPKGASVMNGSSVTLEEIGYVEYLKQHTHGWVNLHANIEKESDSARRSALRKQSLSSDYYLGSVHALVEDGVFLHASNTGSQLPHIAYSSANLIFVVGTQKIVPSMDEAMKRLETYVFPLEHEHMMKLYNMGSNISKILISRGDAKFLNREIHFILVKESVGF